MVYRRPEDILPIEQDLVVAIALNEMRGEETHGYALQKRLEREGRTVGAGTIYRALWRLLERGYVTARWEDPVGPGRPRRRLYSATGKGLELAGQRRPTAEPAGRLIRQS